MLILFWLLIYQQTVLFFFCIIFSWKYFFSSQFFIFLCYFCWGFDAKTDSHSCGICWTRQPIYCNWYFFSFFKKFLFDRREKYFQKQTFNLSNNNVYPKRFKFWCKKSRLGKCHQKMTKSFSKKKLEKIRQKRGICWKKSLICNPVNSLIKNRLRYVF